MYGVTGRRGDRRSVRWQKQTYDSRSVALSITATFGQSKLSSGTKVDERVDAGVTRAIKNLK